MNSHSLWVQTHCCNRYFRASTDYSLWHGNFNWCFRRFSSSQRYRFSNHPSRSWFCNRPKSLLNRLFCARKSGGLSRNCPHARAKPHLFFRTFIEFYTHQKGGCSCTSLGRLCNRRYLKSPRSSRNSTSFFRYKSNHGSNWLGLT